MRLESLYIGGGTPTTLDEAALEASFAGDPGTF